MADRLGLGTVQFGLDYGLGTARRIPEVEVLRILRSARSSGFDTLDTAAAYGDSEEVLGRAGVAQWRTVTKLPGLPHECGDARAWVAEAAQLSMHRLGVSSLHGLLLHRPGDLLGPAGEAIHAGLLALREAGVVRRIGVSIYDPSELDAILPRFSMDLVQAPFNVLDRRLVRSGWLSRLAEAGVEVHARSVFLQGLLLMPASRRPARFSKWGTLWRAWEQWLQETELHPLQACLGFVLGHAGIDRAIVGVDGHGQLLEIVASSAATCPPLPRALEVHDLDLLDPSRWSTQ